MAKILSESFDINKGLNEDDLRARYLAWWKSDAFDTGPTYASVFSKVEKGMDPKLLLRKYMWSLDLIHQVVAHQRAPPLAGMFNIPTEDLISVARKEAKLTHFHDDAGYGSAVVILLCRYMLEGKSYKDAKELVSVNHKLKDSWERIQKAELKPDGYVFNVIHSASFY